MLVSVPTLPKRSRINSTRGGLSWGLRSGAGARKHASHRCASTRINSCLALSPWHGEVSCFPPDASPVLSAGVGTI